MSTKPVYAPRNAWRDTGGSYHSTHGEDAWSATRAQLSSLVIGGFAGFGAYTFAASPLAILPYALIGGLAVACYIGASILKGYANHEGRNRANMEAFDNMPNDQKTGRKPGRTDFFMSFLRGFSPLP